ncbi:MAG: endonuclease/exonuclease/phosphatase family protein [bacterium]
MHHLRLVSFNLHNLGREDNPDAGVYESKLEYLSDVLRRIDGDLVVVNEVREADSFKELVERLAYPTYHLADPPVEQRRIQVGIMSRLPVLAANQWLEYPTVLPHEPGVVEQRAFRRPMPWVKVRLPNDETLFLLGVHLKSRRAELEGFKMDVPQRRQYVLGRALSASMRMLEAAGLRLLMDEVMDAGFADHFAVAGDYNAGPDSLTTVFVTGLGEEEGGDAAVNERRRLLPSSWKLPAERAFSYVRRGRRELIDHILVSQRLSLCMTAAGVENQLLEAAARSRWESGSGYPRSDHAPVWADFRMPPAVKRA